MSISFYDASVASYLQTLGGISQVMDKGEKAAQEGAFDLADIVRYRMRDDMAPFSFQVISVWHHSLGAIKGCKAGLFAPPPKMSDMDWSKLRGLIKEAQDFLREQEQDDINALSGKPMVFRIGEREIPFTTDNFLLSFSQPNFYFHATTTYAVLRQHGVPLGKMDYLGPLRVDN
ncbi:MAG: DUF1993 domain-containing protein [Pseudomonadota bacterium]